jgi:uncharacterized protein
MIYLDTGYFLALFNAQDQLHSRALKWSAQLNESTIVSEYVLWECVNAFSEVHNRHLVRTVMQFVRTDPSCDFVPATPELFEAGLALHQSRTDKEWSLTDCISFNVMKERNISRALAHDHHFVQAGYHALLRSDPPN